MCCFVFSQILCCFVFSPFRCGKHSWKNLRNKYRGAKGGEREERNYYIRCIYGIKVFSYIQGISYYNCFSCFSGACNPAHANITYFIFMYVMDKYEEYTKIIKILSTYFRIVLYHLSRLKLIRCKNSDTMDITIVSGWEISHYIQLLNLKEVKSDGKMFKE